MSPTAQSSFQPLRILSKQLPLRVLSENLHKPWNRLRIFQDGRAQNLPESYRKFYYDWKVEIPEQVQLVDDLNPSTKYGENNYRFYEGNIVPHRSIPLDIHIPDELHYSLLGGTGVIEGILKYPKKNRKNRNVIGIKATYFIPELYWTVLYSEVFNKHFKFLVSTRIWDLIDKYGNLDEYIFQSKTCDLNTLLAVRMKREMFLALHDKTVYTDDKEKQDEIYNKYEKYLIPREDAVWYGLSLQEALEKYEADSILASKPVPYKLSYRQDLIQYTAAKSANKGEETSEPIKEESTWDKLTKKLPFTGKKD